MLNQGLREATLVDGDRDARHHVEIDIRLVAGLLEQQPQQLGQLVAQLLVVLGENLRGIRVADRVQRVLGRDEIPTRVMVFQLGQQLEERRQWVLGI